MNSRILPALVFALALVGCGGNARFGGNCVWPADHATRALDLTSARDARHLADDAQTAEDLAIRHADMTRGPRKGRRDVPAYRLAREECKATLYSIVAKQHSVGVADVEAGVGRRRVWLDALVILAFAAIFVMVAKWTAAYLFRSALADTPALAAPLVLVMSLGVGGAGVLAGGVWFGLIESVRVGNGHMSYRAERSPFRGRGIEIMAIGSTVFLCIAAVQYRKARPS